MPSSACQTCARSEEHTSELQSHSHLVCRLLLEKKTCGSEEHTSELQSHSHLVCRLLLEKKNISLSTLILYVLISSLFSSLMHSLSRSRVSFLFSSPFSLFLFPFLLVFFAFFFLKDRAPPNIYPLPQRAVFRI